MHRIVAVSVPILLVAGLGACASGGGPRAAVPASAPGTTSNPMLRDEAYVALVEAKARRRGVDVQWVNIPRRRATPATGEQ